MSQSMRVKRELRAVTAIGPQKPGTTLLTGMRWDEKNNAASHATSDNFKARQIARGLKPRDDPK